MDDRQFAYLVMEFLDGQNLSDFLKKNPSPASDEILDIVDQIALALDAAHESGIVHRDLKPDNIWLQPNHRGGFNVKVLDFGIAKLRNAVDMGPADLVAKPPISIATRAPAPESQTLAMVPSEAEPGEAETVVTYASVGPVIPAAGGSLRFTNANSLETTVASVLGTPAYMAPEQCQGANVGPSADIYSLSVIVYQMFCGCLPFEAASLQELLKKQIEELPTPPAERDPGISKRVSEAIMGGLSKVPAARPPSAMGFAAQLRAGSEAELKLLADGKVVASNHGNCFFPLLLAADYVAGLKQRSRKVVTLALRQLLRLVREYPREPLLGAVREAGRDWCQMGVRFMERQANAAFTTNAPSAVRTRNSDPLAGTLSAGGSQAAGGGATGKHSGSSRGPRGRRSE